MQFSVATNLNDVLQQLIIRTMHGNTGAIPLHKVPHNGGIVDLQPKLCQWEVSRDLLNPP